MIKNFNKSIKSILPRKLINRNSPTEISIGLTGHKLLIPQDMAWAFEGGEYYERNVIHFLNLIFSKYVQPVFIDIGSNYGYYAVKYANASKKIFCFEPVSKTHSILIENLKQNHLQNVSVYKIGLSNIVGEALINLYSSSGNNSIFERNIPPNHPLKKIGTERIQLTTLDEMIKKEKGLSPDIIKIDVEGAELQVLEGAATTIATFRPTILIEYSESTSLDAGYIKDKLLDQLRFPEYTIYGVSDDPNNLKLIEEKHFQTEPLSNLLVIPNKIALSNVGR
jgi:FkbM family methyltransferase